MRRVNVDVELLNTYFVVSNMSKVRRPSAMVQTPAQYVHATLTRLGRATGALGRPYTLTPWPMQAWLDWATARIVPSALLLRMAYGTCRLSARDADTDVNLDTRRRAIRKAQRTQKTQ